MNFFYRKIFHLLSLILIIPVIFLDYKERVLLSSCLFLLVLLVDSMRQGEKNLKKFFLKIFNKLLKKDEFSNYTGATYLFLSYLILNAIFKREIIIFSLLILCICDPIAAICGKFTKSLFRFNNKTLNGFVGFAIAGLIISIIPMNSIPFYSKVLAVLISGIFELIVKIDDNFIVPISSAAMLSLIK
jgi:dolichol kinase